MLNAGSVVILLRLCGSKCEDSVFNPSIEIWHANVPNLIILLYLIADLSDPLSNERSSQEKRFAQQLLKIVSLHGYSP